MSMDQPTLTCPCQGPFTRIGSDENAIRNDVAICLQGARHRLTPTKKRRHAKYFSLHLDTQVTSENTRNRLFAS
jgi:hypothetical protein